MNANALSTNILATCVVLATVFVMPWCDRTVCRRLGLNLTGGVSDNPRSDRLLRLRRLVLYGVLALYLGAFLWLTLLSRSAMREYQIHVAPLEDLQSAIVMDLGPLKFLRTLFTQGVGEAFSHITVISPADIAQFYLNIMVFVPMGYLLPYVFEWFRARVRYRPVVACFLISMAVENTQLITRRGFYDVDDIIANTIGGLIGQMLYIAVGYVVTHPQWRRDLAAYRRWQHNARHRTLYPFARKIGNARVTILATDETAVWDFYVTKLGFRPRRQIVRQDGPGTDFLFEMGKMQLEVRCSNQAESLPAQYITFTARRLPAIRKRLSKNGIVCGDFTQDSYTARRQLTFAGPDGVRITIMGM